QLKKSVSYLESKQVNTEQIENVCIDMSPSFISGCEKHLPNAAITFDKFHVIKEVNKAMDEVRKIERSIHFDLKGHKYTFLKNNLTVEKQQERDSLLDKYKNLADAYRLTQMFKDGTLRTLRKLWGIYLWCHIADESNLAPFIKASK